VSGLIRNDQERVESLDEAGKVERQGRDRAYRQPGGTTAGSEQLHGALRGVAAAKPLVVVVDGLAASGGYIAAMSADHIIAQETSLVGSIGVLFQYPMSATVEGRRREDRGSQVFAAQGGAERYEPTSPEARAAIEALVKDSYAWFRGMVSERRKMDGAALETVTDGRVFTGGRRSRSGWSISSATRRPPWPGSPPKRG
jgi:protease-4